MEKQQVTLVPLSDPEKESFIRDIQAAFKKAVVEEWGDNGEEVIPRQDIEEAFQAQGAESYHIVHEGRIVGGTVLAIHPETNHNELSLLFIKVGCHSKGLGFAAWQAIEKLHPETEVWETCTPYFEKRNIHFYVNKCGFHVVEFFNPSHPEPAFPHHKTEGQDIPGGDYFLRFEKKMKERTRLQNC